MNMNPHCECPISGFCNRHKILKSPREHSLCRGTADTEDCGSKYFFAWEQGKLGATAPDEPVLVQDWDCGQPGNVSQPSRKNRRDLISKIGDRLQAIIEEELKGIIPCSLCKEKIRSLNEMTPDQVQESREEIVRDIASRAREEAPKFWQRIAVTIDQALNIGETERMIVGWLDEAVNAEEKYQKKKRKKEKGKDRTRTPIEASETPPDATKKPKTNNVSRDTNETPLLSIGVSVGKTPKRIKPTKHPPYVSFIEDHHGRPTDALDGLYPDGTAFLVCGGPSTRKLDWKSLQQPGVLTASLNNAPCSMAHGTKAPANMFRPNLWFSVDEPQHFNEAIFKDPGITKFLKTKYRKTGRLRTKDGKHWDKQKTTPQGCSDIWYYRHAKSFAIDDFLEIPEPTWFTQPNRSVMFVAMRILFYLGIRRLYLIGCDFHQNTKDSYGFDDPMPSSRATFNTNKFERVNDIFCKLRPHFEQYGFQVLNCTPGGKLDAFDRVPLNVAIADATSEIPEKIETRGLYLT